MAEADLVRYSRAGDVFHYRWAARRCLRMIYPNSKINMVVIEGSKERDHAGEYVIDIAEYYSENKDIPDEIAYYQLKHSTIRKEEQFTLSELKVTIEGFAKRYSEQINEKQENKNPLTISFSIVTNRPISESFKKNILAIIQNGKVNNRFLTTLKKYTDLSNAKLIQFCTHLRFIDGEGDYVTQRHLLHEEINQLLAGPVDPPQIDFITALIQEKALPASDGQIIQEDILRRFGVSSARDLFPAPPELENLKNIIHKAQYETLLEHIQTSTTPIIITASGGVGKSVFAKQIVEMLPIGSVGIVYDCFGGGRYRTRSGPRHRHRDALVQIVNELATRGLCDPLITSSTCSEDTIMRGFLSRIQNAANSLQTSDKNANLIIIIDAADNAEMAAREFGDSCFAHELLREEIPDGCKLVMLSRPERVNLLQATNIVPCVLEPFSEEESLNHLRNQFPEATEIEGLEFHRLTSGNPRVQANALSITTHNIHEILSQLGPDVTTIEEQIEKQLESAIFRVKDKIPGEYQQNIDAICQGLATLPPLIPIKILAIAANVDESTVRSFVADFGHHLWLSDSSVQFRDEPTETWFRKNYSATRDQIAFYIDILKPLSTTYTYVAESLPTLLLQAEKFDELITIALSDDYLPSTNPIDERNVRIYRLQFAFRAALKLRRFYDATKLALRAGEEVAGDERQLELLTKNIDLVSYVQSQQKVQELAFQRRLHGSWEGSENIYSAALLSSIHEFKGEASSYLRSGKNWLNNFLLEQKNKTENNREKRIKDLDIVELAITHLNLFGIKEFINIILMWRPSEVIYRISKIAIRRLIDAGNFDTIEQILQTDIQNQYFMLAISEELIKIGRIPDQKAMKKCLLLLSKRQSRIAIPEYEYGNSLQLALISFIEACVVKEMSYALIMRVLKHYFPIRATNVVLGTFQNSEREVFFRVTALRCILKDNIYPNYEEMILELLPKDYEKYSSYERGQKIEEFKEILESLLPWCITRAYFLTKKNISSVEMIENTEQYTKNIRSRRWRGANTIEYEISKIIIDIFSFCIELDDSQINNLYKTFLESNQNIWNPDIINAVRIAFRSTHLSCIRRQLEQKANAIITNLQNEEPETKADMFIDLARAIYPEKPEDAAAYFNMAIEAVSKFGDERRPRWEAINALVNQATKNSETTPEMSYRYVRCAELVGSYGDFNYGEAIKNCAKLSPVSSLATISRWHDRDVGYFYDLIPGIANELLLNNNLSPSVGWSLSAFYNDYGLDDFAALCIEKESNQTNYQCILQSAIRDLRLQEVELRSWGKLQHAIKKHDTTNCELDELIFFYANNSNNKNDRFSSISTNKAIRKDAEAYDWNSLFDGLDLITSQGISQAKNRFSPQFGTKVTYESFWQEYYLRISEGNITTFLDALSLADAVDRRDIRFAIIALPPEWKTKPSVKEIWKRFVGSVAKRFANELISPYSYDNFCLDFDLREENAFIQEKIIEGLSEIGFIYDARIYFDFVCTASTLVTTDEAYDLIDFALSRFELHIDPELSDGPWGDWLLPPDNIIEAFTGFIWSSLGSPRAELRWRAVHCVKRLADLNCKSEIDALLQWIEVDSIGAFGSKDFPFYYLHACQYLLIALARISIDKPMLLHDHGQLFTMFALEKIPHILIRKFSSEIALNIEASFPGTYTESLIERFKKIGKSQLPIQRNKNYKPSKSVKKNNPGKSEPTNEFHFGWDFSRYWLEPLGNVFNISQDYMRELVKSVIWNSWNIINSGGINQDPRNALWQSTSLRDKIRHDHGSYPHIDTYGFYLSYHAMLCVSTELLENYPVVKRWDDDTDEWGEWLSGHILTRADNLWLADRRDPAPLSNRSWIFQRPRQNWTSDISNNDFLVGLISKKDNTIWLNIFGTWEEQDHDRYEGYRISSAFVSSINSQSLLNALSTCKDPNDFKLPDFQEENMEIEKAPFSLKGWISKNYTDNNLDEHDPFAGPIQYPPYKIGQSIAKTAILIPDSEYRNWYFDNEDEPSFVSEIWYTEQRNYSEIPEKEGNRLSASLTAMQRICAIFQCEIILEVQINRYFISNSYTREESEDESRGTHNKIFILSADGRLRDTNTYYQFREAIS